MDYGCPMTIICLLRLSSVSWLIYRGDASLIFLTGSCIRSSNVVWNRKLMKIWSVKITHENWNWMKNWLSMDSTLRIFSKTNSSSWLRKNFNLRSRWLFKDECGIFYINQSKCHLDRDSRENGRFGWKNENPWFKNFYRVMGLILALAEVEKTNEKF